MNIKCETCGHITVVSGINSDVILRCFACGSELLRNAVTGTKHDSEKPRMDLLPFDALEEVARVITFGAKKYAENDWKNVPNADDYFTGKIMRHLTAHRTGKKLDAESGLLHAAHIATDALFLLWFEIQKNKDVICETCGTINNAHHSAACVDQREKKEK